jgi:hypothetical protein
MNSGRRGRNDGVQGEGDFDADRRYRSDVRKFVRNHDVEQAARDAEPSSAAEAASMKEAEQAGLDRSKGDDETDAMKSEERDTPYDDIH